ASEVGGFKWDGQHNLGACAPAHERLARNVGIPARVVGVNADAIGAPIAEVAPPPPIRQVPVCGDVESGKPFAVRLGNDQGRIIRSHGHAIWKGDAISHLPSHAVGCDQRYDSRSDLLTGTVKSAAGDVSVA